MNERHGVMGLILIAACSQSTVSAVSEPGTAAPDAASADSGAPVADDESEDRPGDGGGDGDGDGDGDGHETDPECSTILAAVVRDFGSHLDFENNAFLGQPSPYAGIVSAELGDDRKPIYAAVGATGATTGPAEFLQWYNDEPGVNVAFEIMLPMIEQSGGLFVFDDQTFFPIDGRGFGDGAIDEQSQLRNFGFTTEIHTEFEYKGGEVFTFVGDDDLWLFINHHLAIDLGGVHSTLSHLVDLDAVAAQLEIVPGRRYAMDIFHAERHSSASTFRIETTIDCLTPVLL